MTPRLRRQIESDFPRAGDEIERLLAAARSDNQDRERVLAAIVFIADGNVARLRQAVALSQLDWRDVLVNGDLADGGWPQVLDARLGPPTP